MRNNRTIRALMTAAGLLAAATVTAATYTWDGGGGAGNANWTAAVNWNDPRDGVGAPRLLCETKSSNVGAHWNTDHCPYDDEDYQQGKWKVYAPQHTHPHPSFRPDGHAVVFTSDRTGHSQIYEVECPPHGHTIRAVNETG